MLILFTACNNSETASQAGADSTSHKNDSVSVALFDGQTLKGWHTYGKNAPGSAWKVDSGAIHLQPGAKNGYQLAGGGDLVTDSSFGNFDLTLEWKIGKKANS